MIACRSFHEYSGAGMMTVSEVRDGVTSALGRGRPNVVAAVTEFLNEIGRGRVVAVTEGRGEFGRKFSVFYETEEAPKCAPRS